MATDSPNMGLKIWNHSLDPYNSEELADNLARIDQHDHANGRGVQIPTAGLVDGSITQAKLAEGVSLPTASIPDASLVAAKFAASAVDSNALAAGSVIAAKLGAGAVGTSALGASSVTAAKFAQLPALRVTKSANQTVVQNTATLITWNTETYDLDNMHSTVSNTDRLVATTAGTYMVFITLTMTRGATPTGYRRVSVYANTGTLVAEDSVSPYTTGSSSDNGASLSPSGSFRLSAGQYFYVEVLHNQAETLNVRAAESSASMVWCGP